MACTPSSSIDCDCEALSLSEVDVYANKTGDVFNFFGFNEGNNVQFSTTPNGIVVSLRREQPRALVGLNEVVLSGNQILTGSIFNNNTVIGNVNTGLFSAGVTTIPESGLYQYCVQLKIGQLSVFDPSEFARIITFAVNNVATGSIDYKVSFSNETMSICASQLFVLNVGDQVTVQFSLGGNNATYRLLGGANSFISIKKL
jgi:hypothetical protein